MKKNGAFRRAAALMAALSITVSLAAPAFAATSRTYYIDDGDITITKDENGQTVQQVNKQDENIGPMRRSSSPPIKRPSPRWRATWKAPQQRIPALACGRGQLPAGSAGGR